MNGPPSGTLWASPVSTCSRRVIACLHEVGADWDFVPIDLGKGEQKSEAVLAIQPYGKVPIWQDTPGAFTLFESRAIVRHLAEGSHLVPADAKARAFMEQWISIDYSYFGPSFLPIYYMRFLRKVPLDEAKCAEHEAALLPTLDILESRLAESEYLACTDFSLADLTYLCYFAMFDKVGLQGLVDSRPKLSAWWKRCSERESWRYAMLPAEILKRTRV